jgi:hypothetical protein
MFGGISTREADLLVFESRQVAAYQDWLVANRERCHRAFQHLVTPPFIGGKDTTMPEIKLDRGCRYQNRKASYYGYATLVKQ